MNSIGLLGVGHAGGAELFNLKRGYRQCGFTIDALDQRTGYFDALQALCCGRCLRQHTWSHSNQACAERRADRDAKSRFLKHL